MPLELILPRHLRHRFESVVSLCVSKVKSYQTGDIRTLQKFDFYPEHLTLISANPLQQLLTFDTHDETTHFNCFTIKFHDLTTMLIPTTKERTFSFKKDIIHPYYSSIIEKDALIPNKGLPIQTFKDNTQVFRMPCNKIGHLTL